jgi:valine dehydrogenase (NAD+)
MSTDSHFAPGGPEQIVYCHDEPSGLRAIIAVHSTALGPSLGGTRFYPYASEAEALADVPAAWPTRTRSPGSTSAAARP